MKPSLKEFTDYYLLPEDVWRALVAWYGTAGLGGGPPLPRPVSNGTIHAIHTHTLPYP